MSFLPTNDLLCICISIHRLQKQFSAVDDVPQFAHCISASVLRYSQAIYFPFRIGRVLGIGNVGVLQETSVTLKSFGVILVSSLLIKRLPLGSIFGEHCQSDSTFNEPLVAQFFYDLEPFCAFFLTDNLQPSVAQSFSIGQTCGSFFSKNQLNPFSSPCSVTAISSSV